MSVGDIGRRALFEILFFSIFPILMVYHMILVYVLATYECFKVYPSEIYEFTKRIVYGKEDS